MEDFKISQLTKELVVIRLKNMGDPCAAAAELVKKTLSVALKGIPPGDSRLVQIVRDACQGGMTGLLVAEQSLAKGAVKLLQGVGEVAMELGLDPTQAMHGALEGIADLHRFVNPGQMESIKSEIDANLIGAGDAFRSIWQSLKAQAQQAQTQQVQPLPISTPHAQPVQIQIPIPPVQAAQPAQPQPAQSQSAQPEPVKKAPQPKLEIDMDSNWRP